MYIKDTPTIYRAKINKMFNNNDVEGIINLLKTDDIYILNYLYVIHNIRENKRANCSDILIFCANHKEYRIRLWVLLEPDLLEVFGVEVRKKIYEIYKSDKDESLRAEAEERFSKLGVIGGG